jgi:hypothetical protein
MARPTNQSESVSDLSLRLRIAVTSILHAMIPDSDISSRAVTWIMIKPNEQLYFMNLQIMTRAETSNLILELLLHQFLAQGPQ